MTNFLKKLKAAAAKAFQPPEFPNTMSSLIFKESVTIPYKETIRREVIPVDFYTYNVKTYDPPKVVHGQYEAAKYTWFEARKIETSEGARYEIYNLSKTVPGLKSSAETEAVRCHQNEKTLFTKEEAMAVLKNDGDQALSKTKQVANDAKSTSHYFGRYIPKRKP